jgi:hypothetical protein
MSRNSDAVSHWYCSGAARRMLGMTPAPPPKAREDREQDGELQHTGSWLAGQVGGQQADGQHRHHRVQQREAQYADCHGDFRGKKDRQHPRDVVPSQEKRDDWSADPGLIVH